MKMPHLFGTSARRAGTILVVFTVMLCAGISSTAASPTNLADAPLGATVIVPANVILALSVEWPTGDDAAYLDSYSTNNEYIGYFNPGFCYRYNENTDYFVPESAASGHACSGHWSGNFLNWALTQTIDPMRKALTGGYRSVDTASVTVLQKAYSDNNVSSGGYPNKTLSSSTLISESTPFNWSSFTIINRNTGLRFLFSKGTPSNSNLVTSYPGDTHVRSDKTYRLYGAVQVCSSTDAPSDLETSTPPGRCRQYGTNYKPVGLMQKYAAENSNETDAIRYSVFGYLNDGNIERDGGVMRARMKSVGPYAANPGTLPTVNPQAEWSASDGTFMTNPIPADATASGVSNSGVVNYLNKFGLSGSYKSYDPVGEMYYATTRYYRKLGNVSSYTSGATSSELDGFPAIDFTTNDDPIKYSCSKNYIIGIGDIHTHADANLPGRSYSTNKEPTMPAQVSADATVVNAKTATDWIATLEHQVSGTAGGGTNDYQLATGIGDNAIDSIGSPTGGWCCNNHSFLMAGLAYDIHTRDIRPDITNKTAPINVSTFWVDDYENGDYHEKNQFWLTAKYGGFDTDPTFNPDPTDPKSWPTGGLEYNMSTPPPTSWWNTGNYRDNHGNLAPDQYYQAANPSAMINGFNAAFAKIRANIPSGTSTALSLGSSTVAASGNANYAASFASDYSGDLVGTQIAITTTGGVVTSTSTVRWHARDWLPNTAPAVGGVTPLTASTRIIATSSSTGASHGTPFEMTAGISSAEAATLGPDATSQGNLLDYVRGDQSNEGAGQFRPRTYTLGDIIDSKPVVQGAPSLPYADTPLNPGYSAFKAAHSSRGPIVYVGANDGMLHAFDGSMTSGTGGKELFAYVPSYLFNANVDGQGNPTGLASLAISPLQHHFMVDAQPAIIDVDFARTRASGTAPADSVASNWHSILISGLGKGGKGFFALDVTDPAGNTSESALAGNVLWETDPTQFQHMGYSYGTPLVIKTAKYGWTVVLTSGYDNDDGKGYLYLVSPKDGTLYETISTGAGSLTNPAGLAFVGGYINNFADYTADSVYAGDLLGNVWRVDLTGTSGASSVQKFATLADSSGNAQPVMTEPVVVTDQASQTRYVFVGTGRLLADSDLVSSAQQTFYAFTDGDNTAFDSGTTTLTRADLASDSNPVAGVAVGAGQRGYYVDLKTYGSSAGLQAAAERINVQPVASGGVVSFAGNLFGQDPCSNGSSRLFALGYDTSGGITGKSLLRDSGGSPVAAFSNPSPGVVTSLSIVSTGSGLKVLAGLNTGEVNGVSLSDLPASLQKLNWREVPTH